MYVESKTCIPEIETILYIQDEEKKNKKITRKKERRKGMNPLAAGNPLKDGAGLKKSSSKKDNGEKKMTRQERALAKKAEPFSVC